MGKIGFNNQKYIDLQSENIAKRVSYFNKLYLEFGGKLFDDYHASRVLPGFEPDQKIKMLLNIKDKVEMVFVINAEEDVEIYGFLEGYKGLIYGNFKMLTSADFSGILTKGGTILGSSRTPFKTIQEAIDSVGMHDTTIHVRPGVYGPCEGDNTCLFYEVIPYRYRVVAEEGPAKTFIDGQGVGPAVSYIFNEPPEWCGIGCSNAFLQLLAFPYCCSCTFYGRRSRSNLWKEKW